MKAAINLPMQHRKAHQLAARISERHTDPIILNLKHWSTENGNVRMVLHRRLRRGRTLWWPLVILQSFCAKAKCRPALNLPNYLSGAMRSITKVLPGGPDGNAEAGAYAWAQREIAIR